MDKWSRALVESGLPTKKTKEIIEANIGQYMGRMYRSKLQKTGSGFGKRSVYNGKPRSPHTGTDLRAAKGTPVKAPNNGRVVLVKDLYFAVNTVIIDHGLGLFSLYAHLSSLGVSVSDQVEQGDELGRSGETGLAGGDHLHFALLVGGTYVEPLEWWDPLWVRTHVEARLAPPNR